MPKVWNKKDPNCPKDAVYIGRPSKWGNPFVIGKDGTREDVVEKYRKFAHMRYHEPDDLFREQLVVLKEKDLICWCAPLACHGDVLLELVNKKKKNGTN